MTDQDVLAALQDAGIPHGINEADGCLEITIRDGVGNLLMRGDFAPPYRDDVLEWMQIQYEDLDSLADEYRVLADMCAEAYEMCRRMKQENCDQAARINREQDDKAKRERFMEVAKD